MNEFFLKYEFNDLVFNLNPDEMNNYMHTEIPLFKSNGVNTFLLSIIYSSKNNNNSIFRTNFNLSFFNKLEIIDDNNLNLTDAYGNVKTFVRADNSDFYHCEDYTIMKTYNTEAIVYVLDDKYKNVNRFYFRNNQTVVYYPESIKINNDITYLTIENNKIISISNIDYKFEFLYDNSNRVTKIKILRFYNNIYNEMDEVNFNYGYGNNTDSFQIMKSNPVALIYLFEFSQTSVKLNSLNYELMYNISDGKIVNIVNKYNSINNTFRVLYNYSYLYDNYTRIKDEITLKYTYINYESINNNRVVRDVIYDKRYANLYEYNSNRYLIYESATCDLLSESLIPSVMHFDAIPYDDGEETYDFSVEEINNISNIIPSFSERYNVNNAYKIEGCGSLEIREDLYIEKDENIKIVFLVKKSINTFSHLNFSRYAAGNCVDSYYILNDQMTNFEIHVLEMRIKSYSDSIKLVLDVDGIMYVGMLKLFKDDIGNKYTYDSNNNVIKVEGNQNVCNYEYNLTNKLIKEEDELTNIVKEHQYSFLKISKTFIKNYDELKGNINYEYENKKLTNIITNKLISHLTENNYSTINYQDEIYDLIPQNIISYTYDGDLVQQKCSKEFKYEISNGLEIQKENRYVNEYSYNDYSKYISSNYKKTKNNDESCLYVYENYEYQYDNLKRIISLKKNYYNDTNDLITYNYNNSNQYSNMNFINNYQFIYDKGLLTEINETYNNNSNQIYEREYDSLNRTIKKGKIYFNYDNDNNDKLTSIAYNNSNNIIYPLNYDNLDRLISDSIYNYSYCNNRIIKERNNKNFIEYKNGYSFENLFTRNNVDTKIKYDYYYLNQPIDDDISIYNAASNSIYITKNSIVDFYPLISDFYNYDYSKTPSSITNQEYRNFIYDKETKSYACLLYGSEIMYKINKTSNTFKVSIDFKLGNRSGIKRILFEIDGQSRLIVYAYNNTINVNYNGVNILNDNISFTFNNWHKLSLEIGTNCKLILDQDTYNVISNNFNFVIINDYYYILIGAPLTSAYGIGITYGMVKNLSIEQGTFSFEYNNIRKTSLYNIMNVLSKECYCIDDKIFIEKKIDNNNETLTLLNHNEVSLYNLKEIDFNYYYTKKEYDGITLDDKEDINLKVIKIELQRGSSNIDYGNITIIKEYEYDEKNRIVNVHVIYVNYDICHPEYNITLENSYSYEYDNNGNLKQQNYIYDTLDDYELSINSYIDNKLTSFYSGNEQSQIYCCSNEYNITYYSSSLYPYMITSTNFLMQFTYEDTKLIEVGINKDNVISHYYYVYNAIGLRIRKYCIKNNCTVLDINYYYDNDENLIYEKRKINSQKTYIEYLYDDGILYGFILKDNDHDDKIYYYIKDKYENIYGIMDSNSKYIGLYSYNAYGIIDSNNTVIGGISITEGNNILTINKIRYKSYYFDDETEMYYLKNRYYNPLTGLFLTPDNPLYIDFNNPNSYNLFRYCYNNPVMYRDPDGNFAITSAFIASVLIGAAVGAGASFIGQGIATHWNLSEINGWQVLLDGFLGAVSGALCATPLNPVLMGITNGVVTFGGSVASDLIKNDGHWENVDYAKAIFLGVINGCVSFVLGGGFKNQKEFKNAIKSNSNEVYKMLNKMQTQHKQFPNNQAYEKMVDILYNKALKKFIKSSITKTNFSIFIFTFSTNT